MSSTGNSRDALQAKAFTEWINTQLAKRQLSIASISDGFTNGFMLINLIEILWNEPIGIKYNSTPRSSFHKMQNIQTALDFLKKKGVKNPGISAGDIANSNMNAILSLACFMINGYIEQTEFNGVKGKKGLLNWCKNVTEGYKGVNFQSLRSTSNGLAFGAIINHFQPSVLNFESLSQNDSLSNANATIKAFQKLGIRPYLDEKDLSCLNDENINILIYCQLYNYFVKNENTVSSPQMTKPPEAKPIVKQMTKPPESKQVEVPTLSKNVKLVDTKTDDNQKNKGIFSIFRRAKSEKKFISIAVPKERKEAQCQSGDFDKMKVQKAIENDDHLANYINDKYGDKSKIKHRDPVRVAKINDDTLKVEFYEDEFHKIMNLAGSRPIISIAGIGGYQAGKSTTLCGLTGNMAYDVGNGHDETTRGVYADGPYDIDYLYERFKVEPREHLLYSKCDDLKPVIYFFDIEGYGGTMHSKDDAKNKELYKQLCSPFTCISSVFFMLLATNPQLDEINTILDTLDIKKLSNNDEQNGNGAIKLVLGIKNYPIVRFKKLSSEDELINQINDVNMKQSVEKIKKECKIFKELEEKGIKTTYSPMFSPMLEVCMVQGYVKSFWYFARDIIRSIETASDGKFMRDAETNIHLFNFISKNYSNPNYDSMLKAKISEEHEASLQKISERIIYEIKEKFFSLIDEQYKVNEEYIEQEKDIQTVSEAYRKMGRQQIIDKIGIIEDSPVVENCVERYYTLISQYIAEKESHLKMERSKYFEVKRKEAIKYADIKLEEEILKSKETLLKLFKQNNFFGFNENQIEKPVNEEAVKFGRYLLNLKVNEMKYLDDTIIKNAQIVFHDKLIPIAKELFSKEKSERAKLLEEKKKIAEEMSKKQIEMAKENEEATAKHMLITKADEILYQLYSKLEENEVEKMKDDFMSKDFYLKNYKPEAQTKLKAKINESIHCDMMNKIDSIIDNLLTSYQEMKNVHIDAIKRVIENDRKLIITKEKIDTIISLKSPSIAQDIRNCVYEARTNLTEIEYEKQNFEDPENHKIIIVKTRRILHPPDGDMIIEKWREARRKPRQFKIKIGKTHGNVIKISKNDYEYENELGSKK